jgi:hypothetical protein
VRATSPTLDMTEWPEHPLVYEINTWPWLRELSAAAGTRITLADVPQAERICALGFDGVDVGVSEVEKQTTAKEYA